MAYRMSKTERVARRNFSRDWYVLDQLLLQEELRTDLPREWHLLEQDIDVAERKEKVTLYLDRSVAKMFRAMGPGYQGVINRVLRVWIQAKIGGFLKLEDAMKERRDWVSKRELDARRAGERPGFDDELDHRATT